jgi:hypothetical protein
MKRTGFLIILGVVALAFAACQTLKPDPAALSASRALYDQLRTGQTQAILAQLPARVNTPATQATLVKLGTLIPAASPTSVKVVGQSFIDGAAKGRSESLSLEYDYPDRTALFRTQFFQPPGAPRWQLTDFNLQVATHQQLAVNSFSFARKPVGQLAFFALAITSPLLMVAALVKVLLTRGLRYKWLWAVVSFVGLFTFVMDWSRGDVLVQWLSLQILGFGMTSGLSRFDPWLIKATVPIGALLILAGLVARGPRKDAASPASGDSAP